MHVLLYEEYKTNLSNTDEAVRAQYFSKAGVQPEAIKKIGLAEARVYFLSDKPTYITKDNPDIKTDEVDVWLLPLYQNIGGMNIIKDIIAFEKEDRGNIRTRLGEVHWIGDEFVKHSKETGAALNIFSDPISWLQNAMLGVVPLRLEECVEDLLSINCPLIAEDDEHALNMQLHLQDILLQRIPMISTRDQLENGSWVK